MLKDYSGYVCRQTLKNIKTDGSFINSVDGYRVRSVFASTLFNIILFERSPDATTRVFTRKSNMLFFSLAYFAYLINKNKNSLFLIKDGFIHGRLLSSPWLISNHSLEHYSPKEKIFGKVKKFLRLSHL